MSRYTVLILAYIILIVHLIFLFNGYTTAMTNTMAILNLFLVIIGTYDLFSQHNILRLYPIIGHLRYIFEFIRPEIQQYFVATNISGRPYNRETRSLVYQRSKSVNDTLPFGTQHDIINEHYHYTLHSINVKKIQATPDLTRITFGGDECTQPYSASRINISAMSFGALSANAIKALNLGAKLANIAHNTGEGGISPYHLAEGGDLIWQIGTGYFGCRNAEGKFDETLFAEKSKMAQVKMIEIKISQGAKPSHGGVLPANKITPEISTIRGVPLNKDCDSPPTHSAFTTPIEMMHFIKKLRTLSGGKPIGFKLCIGKHSDFMAIVKAMLATQILPDFITVDGAEGGTGAAPVEYSNRLGIPGDEGLSFVNNCLIGVNLRSKIKIIASGKIASGFDIVKKIALGADTCNIARAMMLSIGCIQALSCNTNKCPSGIATQDHFRAKAVKVPRKGQRVANYHHNTMESFINITGAMGVDHPDKLTPKMIRYRLSEGDSITYHNLYPQINPGSLLDNSEPDFFTEEWEESDPNHF